MKMVRGKTVTFIFIMLSVLICTSLMFIVRNTAPNVSYAYEAEKNEMTDYDITEPSKLIATIEDELQEQGTIRILSCLFNWLGQI